MVEQNANAPKPGSSVATWVLALGLITALVALYANNRIKEEKLFGLRQEIQKLKESRRETGSEVQKLRTQGDELARLRKENQEVGKLRAELVKLRPLAGELEKVRAENQQLQAQLQQLGVQNQQLAAATQRAPAQLLTIPGLPPIQLLPDDDADTVGAAYLVDLNNLRQMGLATQVYAEDHSGFMPTALSQLKPYFAEDANVQIDYSRYELATTGNLKAQTGLHTLVLIREKRKDKRGMRGYVFGDGSVQLAKE